MTRPRQEAEVDEAEAMAGIVQWYRDELAQPATFPWDGLPWEPVRIGPTWQVDDAGHWLLPDRSIGWQVLGWCGLHLQHDTVDDQGRPKPWRFTMEQARFLLWWYAVDPTGRWLYTDFVLQRLKGWGKDPIGGTLCMVEAFGPCRFAGAWKDDGQPYATDEPNAWVQTAAVAQQQTRNTMRLLPGMVSKRTQAVYGIDIGKTMVHGLADTRLIEAVTSSPATLEGARASFVLKNETQHWLDNENQGHEMAATIARNAAKSPAGAARSGAITNAFEPGQDSVAEADRQAWEDVQAGTAEDVGLLYDSLEAHPEAPLSAEAAPDVIRSVQGDSVWLDVASLVRQILDVRNPPSRSRRYWYNQVQAAEDAWITPMQYDARVVKEAPVAPADGAPKRDLITLGFDGSLSDDHTALIGCSVEHDYLWPLGVWIPKGDPARIDRHDVDRTVRGAFMDYDVVGFYADVELWESYIDTWAEELGMDLCVKASPRHAVAWDIRGRVKQYTGAVERLHDAIDKGPVTFSPDRAMRQHFVNARQAPNRDGISIRKEHRESDRKIDAASAGTLARLARFEYLALPESRQRKTVHRTGRVW